MKKSNPDYQLEEEVKETVVRRRRHRPNLKDIEEEFLQKTGGIIQEKNDFLIPQIRDLVLKHKWINVRPEYQRRRRWDIVKKSKLIESLLLNIPIPPIFLFERNLNRYEVMDGQQRLSSIIDFYEGKFELDGLSVLSDLNGYGYKTFSDKIKLSLDRRRISAVVLLAESKSIDDEPEHDIRRQVFERLNTGGVALNTQELRNCVYASEFNDVIVELAAHKVFRDMWAIPKYNPKSDGYDFSEDLLSNKLFEKMGDCEIVLRFFAFRDQARIKGSVRRILDNCMISNMQLDIHEVRKLKTIFIERLNLVYQLFGEDAFRLPQSNKLSPPLFDAIMVAIDRLWNDREKLLKRKRAINKALAAHLEKRSVYALIVGRANTADAIKARTKSVERLLLSFLRQ